MCILLKLLHFKQNLYLIYNNRNKGLLITIWRMTDQDIPRSSIRPVGVDDSTVSFILSGLETRSLGRNTLGTT